jgi:hypothetical protein
MKPLRPYVRGQPSGGSHLFRVSAAAQDNISNYESASRPAQTHQLATSWSDMLDVAPHRMRHYQGPIAEPGPLESRRASCNEAQVKCPTF